ncbi:hypothetical protein RFI_15735, partial [Reticulomyxa filosa]
KSGRAQHSKSKDERKFCFFFLNIIFIVHKKKIKEKHIFYKLEKELQSFEEEKAQQLQQLMKTFELAKSREQEVEAKRKELTSQWNTFKQDQGHWEQKMKQEHHTLTAHQDQISIQVKRNKEKEEELKEKEATLSNELKKLEKQTAKLHLDSNQQFEVEKKYWQEKRARNC